MPYYLTKLLPLLLMPVSVAIIAMALGLLMLLRGRRRGAIICSLVAILVLWVSSLPIVAGRLSWSLERQFPPVAIEDIPSADCIIVLGGALTGSDHPRVHIELTDSTDRVYQAAKLYRNGKAETVIVAAGNQPWSQRRTSEAKLISDLLVEWGVLRSSIRLDGASRNTRENAINAAALVQENHCESNLLVTSAWHMPRAAAAFKRLGVNVFPVSVDLRGVEVITDSIGVLIPTAEALAATSGAIREWMGIWVYRWKGWA